MSLFKRRQFLASLSKAGVFGSFSFLAPPVLANTIGEKERQHKQAATDVTHSFLTAPYLQNPSPTGMHIMWITSKPSYSWVEYGEGDQMDQKMHAVTDGLVTAYNRINNIALSNLKPATEYSYRVLSKEIIETKVNHVVYGETITSNTFRFTTPSAHPDTVSFLMLNDIHDRPETIPHLMKIAGSNPYDFVFFNGDIFNQQNDEQQVIDHMLTPCTAAFASTKPFLMVRGNHETRGSYARELQTYFVNKDNRYYNAFTWGPVRFVVIDTGEDKEDDHMEYSGLAAFDNYRIQQARWVEKEMQSSAFQKAAFRVVLMHIPHFYTKSDAHGSNHCRELFAPLFNKYGVDLTLSGHTHKYGLYDPAPGEHHYPVIIGGGPKDGNRTVTRIKADAKTLNLSMLRDDGMEVGRYQIQAKRR